MRTLLLWLVNKLPKQEAEDSEEVLEGVDAVLNKSIQKSFRKWVNEVYNPLNNIKKVHLIKRMDHFILYH